MLEKFRANVNAVLTVEIEGSSDDQQETVKEHSYLALPVDFTKEDVARIIGAISVRYSYIKVIHIKNTRSRSHF